MEKAADGFYRDGIESLANWVSVSEPRSVNAGKLPPSPEDDHSMDDWVSISDLNKKQARSLPIDGDVLNTISIARSVGGALKDGSKPIELSFHIGLDVARKARIEEEDSVDIKFSPDGTGAFMWRSETGRYHIHKRQGNSRKLKVAFRWHPRLPKITGHHRCTHVVVPSGIKIFIPQDAIAKKGE